MLDGGPAEPFEIAILQIGCDELEVIASAGMPHGTAIQIETGDMLLLGEVVNAAILPEGFRARVKVRHAVKSMTDLERLNRAILGYGRRQESAGEPVIALRGRTERS